ncbi:MAG: hypothetical protein AAB676_16135 [Verrucomicrobiota bacterium]
MRGWYAFDEGGDSGTGGWNRVRTTWRQGKAGDAMPHGWAVAEVCLLLRDSLAFEDNDRLVLLPGIPPDWFTGKERIAVDRLPTHFGFLSFAYTPVKRGAKLILSGKARPPGGFVLRWPLAARATLRADGKAVSQASNGDYFFPSRTKQIQIEFVQ